MFLPNTTIAVGGGFDICALGSGSRGNAFVLNTAAGTLLVDAGFSRREILCRMAKCGFAPKKLLGVLLTHEHNDHVKGCRILCDEFDIPLYATGKAVEYLTRKTALPRKVVLFEPGDDFSVGCFQVSPFSVPHDAVDPVGFIVRCGAEKVGIATDLGECNTLARHRLYGCNAIILESNYDRDMLFNSNRTLQLKRRINGRSGHLNNIDCAAALPEILSDATKVLMLVHVSSECNTYELVDRTAADVLRRLGRTDVAFTVVKQDEPTSVFHLGGGNA